MSRIRAAAGSETRSRRQRVSRAGITGGKRCLVIAILVYSNQNRVSRTCQGIGSFKFEYSRDFSFPHLLISLTAGSRGLKWGHTALKRLRR